MKWKRIQNIDDLPTAHTTVLVINENDLFPAVASWSFDHQGLVWMRQLEGAEDGDHQTYDELHSTPTHWMPLPDGPLVQEEKE